MKFHVGIIHRSLSNFIVEAETAQEAKEKARELFFNGASETFLGNEFDEIESVSPFEIRE